MRALVLLLVVVATLLVAAALLSSREERSAPLAPAVAEEVARHIAPEPPAVVAPARVDASSPVEAAADLGTRVADQRPAARREQRPRTQAPTGRARLRLRAVSAEDGRPLPEVQLSASVVGGSWEPPPRYAREEARTDEDGRAELELLAEVGYSLEAWAGDQAGETLVDVPPLAPGEERELTIELPTAFDLVFHGVAVAAESGEPVERCRVMLGSSSTLYEITGLEKPLPELEADAGGRFALRFPSWRDSVAILEAPGRARGFAELDAEHATPATARVVPLARGASLELRVRGAPASAGALELFVEGPVFEEPEAATDWSASETTFWKAALDPSGRARIDGLPAERALELALRSEEKWTTLWSPPDELRLAPGEVRELDVDLECDASVTGTLVDAADATPLPHAEVWAVRASGDLPPPLLGMWCSGKLRSTCDAAGRFRFERLACGDWWLGPAPGDEYDEGDPNRGLAPQSQLLRIESGERSRELTLRAWRGLYVCGRVLDPAGEPCDHGFVIARQAGAQRESTSAHAGAFRLGPLTPGTYELMALSGGHARSREVLVQPGPDVSIDLSLRAGGSVSGFLTRGGRRVARDAWVEFLACADGPRVAGEPNYGGLELEEREDEGAFELCCLLPGTYDLIATTALGEHARIPRLIVAAERPIEQLTVELGPGAWIELSPSRTHDSLRVDVFASGERVARGWADRDRAYRFVVPPGELTLRIQGDGGALLEERVVHAAAGDIVEVEMP